MAAPRSRRGTARAAGSGARATTRNDAASIVPDLLRRALGIGFSGLFTTEELLRKAFGDTVPREWVEFAAAQTDRARRELTERAAAEIQKKLDTVDLEQLVERLLRSHAIELEASIRFVPHEGGGRPEHRVRVRPSREEPS
jgi:hypothetical protein